MIRAIFTHLRVHAIGGATQRQFAQRDQIALAKEIAHGALGLLRHIDLAFTQPLEQFLGGQVDERDFVGEIEHAIGNRLPHANARDLPDDVVQAFEVLDVDGRVNVDARVQQFVHVLPPLDVPGALYVGVREFVDEDQLRLASKRRVDIELSQLAIAIFDMRRRQHVETVEHRQRFLAPVRLDDPRHDVDAFFPPPARGLQHRERLADPSRCTEENLQPAALALLFVALDLFEQFVGIGAVHHCMGFSSSSARLSFSTFTRASPNMPNCRPLV